MASYQEFEFLNCSEDQQELLIACLSDAGFDSFFQEENSFKAYADDEMADPSVLIEDLLTTLGMSETVSFTASQLEQKNWNKIWESSYQPIVVKDQICVRASFHPKSEMKFDIEINPEMAFGTGHHATTEMVLELMLPMNLENKTVMDYGCGTGILAIQAEKMGAKEIVAYDFDPIAAESAERNASLNHCRNIEISTSEIVDIQKFNFDLVVANINRNVILNNFNEIVRRMHQDSSLLLSGIMKQDAHLIEKEAQKFELKKKNKLEKGEWIALEYAYK